MKKIVVSVPLDQKLQEALVSKLSQKEWLKDSNLIFAHIFKQENYAYIVPPYIYPNEAQKNEIKEFTNNLLKDLGSKIPSANQEQFTLFNESPKDGMITFLKDQNPDLVVTATRGKHGLEGFFSSSFTEHLMKFAPCDVLVLRGDE